MVRLRRRTRRNSLSRSSLTTTATGVVFIAYLTDKNEYTDTNDTFPLNMQFVQLKIVGMVEIAPSSQIEGGERATDEFEREALAFR